MAVSICDPQLRDVWTKIIAMIPNPCPLRGCSKYTSECWDHAIYLEGDLPCPYLTVEDTQPELNLDSGAEGGEVVEEGNSKSTSSPFPTLMVRKDLDGQGPLSEDHHHRHLCMTRIPHLYTLSQSSALFGKMPRFLSSVHLCDLPSLTSIEENFVSGTQLVEVVLEDLPELQTLGQRAISGSRVMKRFTLRRLPKLTALPQELLQNCAPSLNFNNVAAEPGTNLDLILLEDLPSLQKIDRCCLYRCSGSNDIAIRGFPKLEVVDDYFCYKNNGVQNFVLENLPALTEIGGSMADECPRLQSARLSNLPALWEIGADLLCNCRLLTSVVLEGLPSLKGITSGFLAQCVSLEKVCIQDLPKLTDLGVNFLRTTTSLEELRLVNLPELKYMRPGTLDGSTCRSIFLINLPLLSSEHFQFDVAERMRGKVTFGPSHLCTTHKSLEGLLLAE